MNLKQYTIRLCKKNEYEKLIEFFKRYWDESHVFCRNKKIFEFQHGDARDGEYDFIIAVHNLTNEIHGVLGFISSSTYDKGNIKNPIFVSGALWKVRDDIVNQEIGRLGLGMLFFLLKKYPKAAYTTLGLSRDSQQIYDALHFDFGLMEHYYIANRDINSFFIADEPVVNHNAKEDTDYKLQFISEIPQELKSCFFPPKDVAYIENRYSKHPFYRYEMLGVYKNNQIKSVWITREIDVNNHKCMRIVDIVGDISELKGLEGNIYKFLKERKAEYIDCYCHGINKEFFFQIGFKEVEGKTIIPNYFEPYEKKNVDIYYAAYSEKPIVIFKGDGDQDRPNLLDM